MFYQDKGYETKECCLLRKEIKRLIAKDYLHQFLMKDSRLEPSREEPSQFIEALPEIYMIFGGTSVVDDSNIIKRKYGT